MPISRDQQKYLKNRLSLIRQGKPGRWQRVELPESMLVKRARATLESMGKIIKQYEELCEKATEQRRKAINAAVSACEKAIMFGDDPDKALKALDEFEKTEF